MRQEENIKPIGGYFELELPWHTEYHNSATALNCGRACLEYILRLRQYKKVYVPYFTCTSAIEPIRKLGIPYGFYHIDKDYRIATDVRLGQDEALLYTNYWGLQDDYCQELSDRYKRQLIFDYTQAFFSKPIAGVDTFYSCRKFFGVPDGGYLYADAEPKAEMKQDLSYNKMDSLIKRIDLSPKAGYEDFRRISESFHNQPIRLMSKLTKRLMRSIDYEQVAQRRRKNYNLLRKYLGGRELAQGEVPMVFPFVSEEGQPTRKRLIDNKVFIAKYWPNVDGWAGEMAVETWMANHVLPLPIDQRYSEEDMKRILKLIEA